MTLLSQFLGFLEWIEKAQAFFHFLSQPVGFCSAIAVCLYFPIHLLGCDQLSATTLSCTVALTLFCLLEQQPTF